FTTSRLTRYHVFIGQEARFGVYRTVVIISIKSVCIAGSRVTTPYQNTSLIIGIYNKIISTTGKITIILILNKNELKTDFHVINKEFPIPRDGILGHHFLLKITQ
ncbi:Peptidase A2 domain-containing protein, partial [Aphis craccivora]